MGDRVRTTLADHAPCAPCPLHRRSGAGCAVVEAGGGTALDAFLQRDACYLKDDLYAFSRRFLAQRPRSLLEPEDLVHDVVSRLLADPALRQGGFGQGLRPFLGYLRQVAVRCAISAERREHGRMRCGNCRSFAPYSGLCLEPGHPWTHAQVPAIADPRALDPACHRFSMRREPAALTPAVEAAAAGPEESPEAPGPELIDAVARALLALAETHPRAALVVRGRLLEGRSYETLGGIGASVRTMKRDYALGLAFLRERLQEFATGAGEEAGVDPQGKRVAPVERKPGAPGGGGGGVAPVGDGDRSLRNV